MPSPKPDESTVAAKENAKLAEQHAESAAEAAAEAKEQYAEVALEDPNAKPVCSTCGKKITVHPQPKTDGVGIYHCDNCGTCKAEP